MLRGSVDSRVLLTIQRKSLDHPLVVALTRVLVVPETVTYRREGDIAYFRIYQFNEDTTASLRREFENARNEIGDSMRGVILDLRGDPGGVLDQAVAVADLFMDSGRIVSTMAATRTATSISRPRPAISPSGLPIAILINGNSASASEIVAAALQDSGRAVLIGSNSYGKGTVQTVPRLPNNGEISLHLGALLRALGLYPEPYRRAALDLHQQRRPGCDRAPGRARRRQAQAGAGEGPQHDLAGGYAGPGQAARDLPGL